MLMNKLVKMVKLNNLQYNANRDPEVYRRCVNEPFRIQALLEGKGSARCTLTDVTGKIITEKNIAMPGTFSHEITYSAPGVNVVGLKVEGDGQTFTQDLRLDVSDHAWIG